MSLNFFECFDVVIMECMVVWDIMTVDRLIALASSLGAFLAAFATFLTVSEMKQQRLSSYKPELAFGKCFFFLFSVGGRNKFALSQLGVDAVEKRMWRGEFNQVKLRFFNVGLGTAKDVRAMWSFNIEEFQKIIRSADVDEVSVVCHGESGPYNILYISKDGKKSHVFLNNLHNVSIGHAFPMNESGGAYEISLPHSYEALLLLLFELIIESDNFVELLEVLPPLKVNFEYKDIDGNVIERAFALQFSLFELDLEHKDALDVKRMGSMEFKIEDL